MVPLPPPQSSAPPPSSAPAPAAAVEASTPSSPTTTPLAALPTPPPAAAAADDGEDAVDDGGDFGIGENRLVAEWLVGGYGAAGHGRFLWPVKGKIISGYGPKEGGLFNDGINIGAKEGEDVVAADSGVVVYAGNEIRGFGNLVLVKHADGWMTAYATMAGSW